MKHTNAKAVKQMVKSMKRRLLPKREQIQLSYERTIAVDPLPRNYDNVVYFPW